MKRFHAEVENVKTPRQFDFACYHFGTEDFSAEGLSRRLDNRHRKEFFMLLFLMPGAFWWWKSAERKARRIWPRAGHGWVILISGLHAPLGRLDDYFGSGAGQYLDNTLTSGFVRSATTTLHCHSLYPLPFSKPRARLPNIRMLSKADFYCCCYSLWSGMLQTRQSY